MGECWHRWTRNLNAIRMNVKTAGYWGGEDRSVDKKIGSKCFFLRKMSREEISSVNQDINVLALVKGDERYVFLYNDANRAETLRTLGRFASNPELSFTWYDAAVLSQKIRQESHKYSSASRFSVPLTTEMDD